MIRPLQVGEEPPPMILEGPPKKTVKSKRETADRFRTLNAFVDCTIADLTRSEIAVWMVLYRDTRDGTACLSFDAIAARAGCDRRSVCTALGQLEKQGLVKVVYRGGIGRGISVYRVFPIARPP